MDAYDPSAAVMPPPPGAVQNLDNPPNGNDKIIIAYSICMAITTFAVVLSVYAKFGFVKRPRIEDYLILPVFAIYLAHCVFWLKMGNTTGNLVHMWNFRNSGLAPFYKNGFYAVLLYEAVMMIIKPLILLEWMHLFASSGANRAFRITCYIVGASNALMYFIAIMIDATSCTPRAFWWDKSIPGGHCVDTRNLPTATAIINAIIDLIILLLPQGIIWRLHMSRRKRLGVSIVFIAGIASFASAIARTTLSFVYSESSDISYNFSKAGYFMVVEMTCAILVFAAPTLPKPTVHLAQQAGDSLTRLVTHHRGSGDGNGVSSRDARPVYSNDMNADSSLRERQPSYKGSDKWSDRPSTTTLTDEEYALPAMAMSSRGR